MLFHKKRQMKCWQIESTTNKYSRVSNGGEIVALECTDHISWLQHVIQRVLINARHLTELCTMFMAFVVQFPHRAMVFPERFVGNIVWHDKPHHNTHQKQQSLHCEGWCGSGKTKFLNHDLVLNLAI